MYSGYKRVRRVMVCICRKCKTKLKTKWPTTWQTQGWWCRIVGGKTRLYCGECSKDMRPRTAGAVARKRGKR